jgi:MFS family permease
MSVTSVESSPSERPAQPFVTLHWTLLLVSLPFGILNFLLPIYGKQIGASALEIGLLFSAFSLMMVLLRPLVGAGLDRYGRRWFFIAGAGTYGLAMLSFAYATQVWGLVLARLLQGAASALLWLAVTAIVADLAGPDQRGKVFGSVSQSSNQGAILGVFIGFTFLSSVGMATGWNQLFLGFAAAGLFAVGLAWKRMPETRPAAQDKVSASAWEGLRLILRSRPLRVLMLVGTITSASAAMTSPVMMIFLQDKFQAEMSELAWAFFPSALVWALLPARLGKLSDRLGRKPLIVAALAIAAVNSLVIPFGNSLILLAGLWVIEALCFAASDPASQALITDLTGEAQRGRVFGMFALAGGMGAVIGPLVGGWLYDALSPAAPFIANSLALVLSAGLLAGLLKTK